MLLCYNRGCGQEYDPEKNTDESCLHHPGMPFFHDAYKGWSCCNKKSVDFTEFLSIKGCVQSKHSNVKPPEPEKPKKPADEEPAPVQEIRQPIKKAASIRPPFESVLTKVQAVVDAGLKQTIDNISPDTSSKREKSAPASAEVALGTVCKNGGCNCGYEGDISNNSDCVHHPGVPVFHEGYKYWSCCSKKTTDFSIFVNQVGCQTGRHKWINDNENSDLIKCRYDWHQTATNVVMAVYAKAYHYEKSIVQVNPIRLAIKLVFPKQSDSEFNLDLELRGMIDVSKTTAHMFGTKIEIIMPKAEPGHWLKLDFPREESTKSTLAADTKLMDDNHSDEEDIDLDDVEVMRRVQITEIPNTDTD